ncbi:natural killer cell receptor 2B4-like [Pimephales promelas]|nr:natural killer cell receptor 2B4-like [Pimephales promelas]
MEGDSVSLNTDITEIQKDDYIVWMFGPQETRLAEIHNQMVKYFIRERFRDRLQMDSQTGSLTIRNIRSDLTGLYKVQIISNRGTSYKRFNVTVYARLPYPVIIRNPSNCSSSSSSSESRCSLLCSVLNVSHVTLSWYKGMSVLSNISVSDLSISLSLPLDVEYQDNNTYSCVINNPVRNQTTHLNNITQLCHTCAALGQRSSFMTVIAVTLALLAAIAVVGGSMCHRRCKQPGKKVNQKRKKEELG